MTGGRWESLLLPAPTCHLERPGAVTQRGILAGEAAGVWLTAGRPRRTIERVAAACGEPGAVPATLRGARGPGTWGRPGAGREREMGKWKSIVQAVTHCDFRLPSSCFPL